MRIDCFVTFFMSGAERRFNSSYPPFGIAWCYLDWCVCGFKSHPLNGLVCYTQRREVDESPVVEHIHVHVLDKAVATKEGVHSAVNCEGLFSADGGKDHYSYKNTCVIA